MPNTLREKVASGELATVMAAHNPLSARLAEEAGFDGIWASGFELSAAYGVPDASLLSFSQHLDMTRAMIEQIAVPLVADLDTGYGNAINVRHVVGAYARACSAAVVIADGWPGPVPLVLVPTAHRQLTEAKLRALGKIAIVIYAKHAVRAAVGAMREVFAAIRRDGGIHQVESRIASVDDIFDLQRVAAMKAAEKKYLR